LRYILILLWGLTIAIGCAALKPIFDGSLNLPRLALTSVGQALPDAVTVAHNQAASIESGNMGEIVRVTPTNIELNLRSDNDQELPRYWRQWWYTKLDNLPRNKEVSFRLKGRGHWNLYIPVYSYDNIRWHQFSSKKVSQPSKHELIFKQKFSKSTVYLARYYPYTYTKLMSYLNRHQNNEHLKIDSMGTTLRGFDIPTLSISDWTKKNKKSQIIIHARTHPGEVASSYLLEGAVSFLLSNDKEAVKIRRNLIIRVVPILNIDGVVVGNNRVSPEGINLEGKWRTKRFTAKMDYEAVPHEVKLFYKKIKEWERSGPPVSMALNLHSSNGQPEDKTFFFPHFGPKKYGYKAKETNLWNKQVSFIDHMKRIQGKQWFNKLPKEGRRDFLTRDVPESWWWKAHKSKVMALTIEATFGKAGDSGRWIKPNQIRKLGSSMGKAIGRYHVIR
jgi:murein tripeptide amidase MpaA